MKLFRKGIARFFALAEEPKKDVGFSDPQQERASPTILFPGFYLCKLRLLFTEGATKWT
jgi:hypothetical protein